MKGFAMCLLLSLAIQGLGAGASAKDLRVESDLVGGGYLPPGGPPSTARLWPSPETRESIEPAFCAGPEARSASGGRG